MNYVTLFSDCLFAEFSIWTNFSVQPEILYSQKGADYAALIVINETEKILFKMEYIDIPVLIKYNIGFHKGGNLNFFAGPVINVNLSAIADYSLIYSGKIDTIMSNNLKSHIIRAVTFSAAFGFGYSFATGLGIIGFDCRYTLPFTDFGKQPTGSFDIYSLGRYEELKAKTSVFTFMLSYGFKI